MDDRKPMGAAWVTISGERGTGLRDSTDWLQEEWENWVMILFGWEKEAIQSASRSRRHLPQGIQFHNGLALTERILAGMMNGQTVTFSCLISHKRGLPRCRRPTSLAYHQSLTPQNFNHPHHSQMDASSWERLGCKNTDGQKMIFH